jgi:hypothetical protein
MRRALLVLVVLPLAACGGSKKNTSETNLSPPQAVREAAAKTVAQKGEHIALNGTATLSGQQVIVTGNGDFKSHAGMFHLDFNAGGLSGTIDAVLDGSKLYLRSPLLQSANGKSWLELDLAKAKSTGTGATLSAIAAQDPTRTLEQLGALSHVTKIGDEQVGGVATTHYRGRLPASATKPGGIYDVWVGNDDGFVHRVRVSSRIAGGATLDATTDLSDYGKSVTITVPPASQTERKPTLSLNLGG